MERIAPDTPPHQPSAHVWRFGDCEVDERRRDLRVRGTPIELEAKPWEVLHQLLLHAGEVVTKEELLDSVWPGLTVVDSSLATAISKLRKALGDESLIITLPRIGYRLAIPVQTSATPVVESAELSLAAGQSVPSRDQWLLLRRLDRQDQSTLRFGLRLYNVKTDSCRSAVIEKSLIRTLISASYLNQQEVNLITSIDTKSNCKIRPNSPTPSLGVER